MGSKAWDKRLWQVTCPGREPLAITTTEGATWALRSLIAAGQEGLRPIDGAGGRFGLLIARLRRLGVEIRDMEADELGRGGFILACQVESRR